MVCDYQFVPPPERLAAPNDFHAEVTKIFYQNDFREVIKISWKMENIDTSLVSAFSIIRQAHYAESTVLQTEIDDTVRELYDIVENLHDTNAVVNISYKIFAIDTLGRAGDISLPYIVSVAPLAIITYPLDTMKENLIKWKISGLLDRYFSQAIILKANDTSTIWQSDSIYEWLLNVYDTKESSTSLPYSIFPLSGGEYYLCIRLEIVIPKTVSYTFKKLYL